MYLNQFKEHIRLRVVLRMKPTIRNMSKRTVAWAGLQVEGEQIGFWVTPGSISRYLIKLHTLYFVLEVLSFRIATTLYEHTQYVRQK